MIWGGITVEVIHMDQAVLGTQHCLLIRYLFSSQSPILIIDILNLLI
jgi:hypothetical protein